VQLKNQTIYFALKGLFSFWLMHQMAPFVKGFFCLLFRKIPKDAPGDICKNRTKNHMHQAYTNPGLKTSSQKNQKIKKPEKNQKNQKKS
jgi:hypothetical protein